MPFAIYTVTKNMKLNNKFAIGDKVFVVHSYGPNIVITEAEVQSFCAEVLGYGSDLNYIYGFNLPSNTGEEVANLTFLTENQCFTDEAAAIKQATKLVENLIEQYEDKIKTETANFEEFIKNLTEQKNKVNADNLFQNAKSSN